MSKLTTANYTSAFGPFNTEYESHAKHWHPVDDTKEIPSAFGEGDIVKIKGTETHFRIRTVFSCGPHIEYKLPPEPEDGPKRKEWIEDNKEVIDVALENTIMGYYRVTRYSTKSRKTVNPWSPVFGCGDRIHVHERNGRIIECCSKDKSVHSTYQPEKWVLVVKASANEDPERVQMENNELSKEESDE